MGMGGGRSSGGGGGGGEGGESGSPATPKKLHFKSSSTQCIPLCKNSNSDDFIMIPWLLVLTTVK